MSLTSTTRVAPSHWATFLINHDSSGMEDDEVRAANAFIMRQRLGWPVSCEDFGFHKVHDALQECPEACDCQLYTFLTPAEPLVADPASRWAVYNNDEEGIHIVGEPQGAIVCEHIDGQFAATLAAAKDMRALLEQDFLGAAYDDLAAVLKRPVADQNLPDLSYAATMALLKIVNFRLKAGEILLSMMEDTEKKPE